METNRNSSRGRGRKARNQGDYIKVSKGIPLESRTENNCDINASRFKRMAKNFKRDPDSVK